MDGGTDPGRRLKEEGAGEGGRGSSAVANKPLHHPCFAESVQQINFIWGFYVTLVVCIIHLPGPVRLGKDECSIWGGWNKY